MVGDILEKCENIRVRGLMTVAPYAEDPEEIKKLIQSEVDRINEPQPIFKKIGKVIIKTEDFEKTTAHKIKRFAEENRGEAQETAEIEDELS